MKLLRPCPHDKEIKCPNVAKGMTECPMKDDCAMLNTEAYALKKAQRLLGRLLDKDGEE